MYPFYDATLSRKENVLTVVLAVLCSVLLLGVMFGAFWYATQPSEEHLARSQAYFDTVNAASIARICADGTRVYSTSRGQLFVPQPWGAQIISVTGTAESVCSR